MIASPPRPSRLRTLAAATSEAPSRTREVPASWAALPGELVDGGELILLAIKPSMWRPLMDSAPWLVLCGGLVAVLAATGAGVAGLSLAATAQVILLVGFARLGVAVVHWVPTWYVLTNRRIINISGVRRPRISAEMLTCLHDVRLHQPAAQKFLRLGTIVFLCSDGGQPSWCWYSVRDAGDVHARIRRAVDNAHDQPHFGG